MPEPKRYRRKAENVTAVQFNPDDKPWPSSINQDARTGWHYAEVGVGVRHRIYPGDWLVTFDGKSPCTIRVASDLFPKMFEPF